MTGERESARRRLARIRRNREDEESAIVAALDAGLSQREIAERLGRNREWVRQHTPPDRRADRGHPGTASGDA